MQLLVAVLLSFPLFVVVILVLLIGLLLDLSSLLCDAFWWTADSRRWGNKLSFHDGKVIGMPSPGDQWVTTSSPCGKAIGAVARQWGMALLMQVDGDITRRWGATSSCSPWYCTTTKARIGGPLPGDEEDERQEHKHHHIVNWWGVTSHNVEQHYRPKLRAPQPCTYVAE